MRHYSRFCSLTYTQLRFCIWFLHHLFRQSMTRSSTLSFAALFVNAAFSVTQVVSEGWPVAYEESNFADGMADEVGGRVDGRMNVSVHSEEQVGGGVGAGKLSAASRNEQSVFYFNSRLYVILCDLIFLIFKSGRTI